MCKKKIYTASNDFTEFNELRLCYEYQNILFSEEFCMYPKTSICHQAPRLKVIPNGEEIAERMLQVT